MKTISSSLNCTVLVVITFCLSAVSTQADEPRTFSVDWIRKSCTAMLVAKNDPNNFTKNQEKTALQFMCWLNGFMGGAHSMSLAVPEEDKNSEFMIPPPDWFDSATLVPVLLAFVNENPEVSGTASAREFLQAFYYLEHPKATALHKARGKATLNQMKQEQNKSEQATPRKPSD